MKSKNRTIILCIRVLLALGLLASQDSLAIEKVVPGAALRPGQISIKSVSSAAVPSRRALAGTVSPGRTLNIAGGGFFKRGTVVLQGLQRPTGPAPAISLAVSKWTDPLITATVPANVSGLLDSNATLVVKSANGKSATHPVKFVAARETLFVPYDLIRMTCPNPDSLCNPVNCGFDAVLLQAGEPGYIPGQTISRAIMYGYRLCKQRFECQLPLSGADTFTIALKNGWVLKNDISYFSNESGRTYGECTRTPRITGPNGGEVSWQTKCDQAKDKDNHPLFCPNGTPLYRPSSCEAHWTWSLLMEGPKGVPYK